MQVQKENVFDEQGNTIETIEAASDESVSEAPEATDEAPAEKPAAKFKIGEREFATQDEALAYAQSQVSALTAEQQIADAYRQGIRDAAISGAPAAESVTPAQPAPDDINPEELYTDPQKFLDKFARKIKTETQAELDHKDRLKTQSDQIWYEFTQRHPMLAEFRGEVEDYTERNLDEVRAIIATKGRPAGYDYVATKIKSRFEQYASAVKPKRELPNTGNAASPTARAPGVTPKRDEKKPLSLADQLRSIRKGR